MISVIVQCGRCGQEMVKRPGKKIFTLAFASSGSAVYLCPACKKEFAQWFNGHIKEDGNAQG